MHSQAPSLRHPLRGGEDTGWARPPHQHPRSGPRRPPGTAGRRTRVPGERVCPGWPLDGSPAGEPGRTELGRTAPRPRAPSVHWEGHAVREVGDVFPALHPTLFETTDGITCSNHVYVQPRGDSGKRNNTKKRAETAPHSLTHRQARPGFPARVTPTSLRPPQNTRAVPHPGPKARQQPPMQD